MSDYADDDPDYCELSPAGEAIYWAAIRLAGRSQGQGVLTHKQVANLCLLRGLDTDVMLAELTAGGLWAEAPAGIAIRNYSGWQETAPSASALSKRNRAKGLLSAHARGAHEKAPNSECGKCQPKSNQAPTEGEPNSSRFNFGSTESVQPNPTETRGNSESVEPKLSTMVEPNEPKSKSKSKSKSSSSTLTNPGGLVATSKPAVVASTFVAVETKKGRSEYHPRFEQWWQAWGKHGQKRAAAKAFQALIRSGADLRDFAAATNHAVASYLGDTQFKPHGATFIRSHWEDWVDGPPPHRQASNPVRDGATPSRRGNPSANQILEIMEGN